MKNKDNFNLLLFEALRFFLDNPYEEVYLREFSRKLKISPNTAQRFLNLFLKNNLIKDKRRGGLRYFKANLESKTFKHIKITWSIKKIENSGLIDYLKKEDFSSVVLFGSLAKGDDDLKSDIDLVCIGSKKNADLTDFYRKLGREINIHFFNFVQWKKNKKDNIAFYQDVISTGINLIGEIPV